MNDDIDGMTSENGIECPEVPQVTTNPMDGPVSPMLIFRLSGEDDLRLVLQADLYQSPSDETGSPGNQHCHGSTKPGHLTPRAELSQIFNIPGGVHALPESVMLEGHQLAVLRELWQDVRFEVAG